jgi:hypothetical protein
MRRTVEAYVPTARRQTMKFRKLTTSIVAGAVIALGAGIPAAQAVAPVVHHGTASAHAAQALAALDARWNTEAASYRASQRQLAADRAVKAVDDRWNAQARAYKMRLDAALALKALDARWNAQALFFGLR